LLANVSTVGPMAREREIMEAVTFVNAYQAYESLAKKLVSRFGPPKAAMDSTARTREDYVQELRLHAAKVANVFQRKFGFCTPAERRYTKSSLWHRAMNWKRNNRRTFFSTLVFEKKHGGEIDGYDMQEALEIRQGLNRIFAKCSLDDRTLLLRVAEVGGSARAAWDPDTDGSYHTFARKVANLRECAKYFYGN